MQADEQIRDRFILVEIDNSPEHNADVLSFMGRQASGKAPTEFDLKERIRICQEIVRRIRSEEPFNVVVPFAERIAFTGDPRAFRMFWISSKLLLSSGIQLGILMRRCGLWPRKRTSEMQLSYTKRWAE